MKPHILKYLPKITKRDKVHDRCVVYTAVVDGRKFAATSKLKLFEDIKKVYASTTFNNLNLMKVTYESLIS